MPKQSLSIQSFEGGLNDNSDPRDILDNESSVIENVAVHELGKLRMLGGVTNVHTAPSDADLVAGYGLFQFSHDMDGADATGDIALTPTDYLAISDTDESSASVIDISAAGGSFSNGATANIGTTFSGAASGKANMYFVDGALRVSDAGFNSAASPKWFGHIGDGASARKMMANSATPVSVNSRFYDRTAKPEKPLSSSFRPDEASIRSTATYSAASGEINGLVADAAETVTDTVVASNIATALGGTSETIKQINIEIQIESKSDLILSGGYWKYDLSIKQDDGDGTFSNVKTIENVEGNGAIGINAHVFEFSSAVAIGSKDWICTLTTDNFDTDNLSSIKVVSIEFIKSSGSYSTHGALSTSKHSFHVSFDQTASDVDDAFGWAEPWEVGISLIYDGNQESLITQLYDEGDFAKKTITYTQNARPPDVAIFCQYSTSWNPRITGAVLYMKRTLDKQWFPQFELDFIKGVGKSIFSNKERSVTYSSISSVDNYIFQFLAEDVLEPQLAITYESRNGISHEEKSISSLWKTSCVANRRAYIGNLKVFNEDGTVETMPDTMVRSLPNKFDIFPISESVDVAINDGEEIIALMEFNDRILQFKERTLYIINASQDMEFLEDKLDYRGVTHPASVFKTEYGIVWANKNGCFYYDGQKVNDLLEKKGRPLIKQSTWESFVGNPMVGYSPKTQQIIVVRDCRKSFTLTGTIDPASSTTVTGVGTKFLSEVYVGDQIVVSGETRTVSSIESDTSLTVTSAFSDNSNDTSPDCIPAGDAFIYDMKTGSWVKGVGIFPNQNKTNFVVDWDGDLIYSSHDGSSTSLLKKWTDIATQTLPKIVTKDIDFGSPSRKKSIKKVYLTFKGDASNIEIFYGINGLLPSSLTFKKMNSGTDGSSANSDHTTAANCIPVNAGTTDWLCAELKPSAGSVTCNSFRIAIDGTAATDFEINDISIVYRPKTIK